jgi:hypothetical protein
MRIGLALNFRIQASLRDLPAKIRSNPIQPALSPQARRDRGSKNALAKRSSAL